MVNLFYNLECISLQMNVIEIIISVNFNLLWYNLDQTNLFLGEYAIKVYIRSFYLNGGI